MTSSERSKHLTREPGIDALRGLAILLVVIHHLSIRIPFQQTALADWLPAPLLSAINNKGWSAVYIFFVISGFLIAHQSLRRWGTLSRIDARDFYVRRASRILPLLLLFIAVHMLLHWTGVNHYVVDQPGQTLTGAAFSALTFHVNWYEAQTTWLPGGWDVLWSLSIEELFYLCFPLVCLGLRDARLLAFFVAMLALSMPLAFRSLESANEIWQEKAYWPGMAAIATGIFAALAMKWRAPSHNMAGMLRLLGYVGIAASLAWMPRMWKFYGNGAMLVLAVCVAALLVGLQARPNRDRRPLPALGWLRGMGRNSYEIYLTHMFVVYPVVDGFTISGASIRYGMWWYPPAILLCALLGMIVQMFISTPIERALRRRWSREGHGGQVIAYP